MRRRAQATTSTVARSASCIISRASRSDRAGCAISACMPARPSRCGKGKQAHPRCLPAAGPRRHRAPAEAILRPLLAPGVHQWQDVADIAQGGQTQDADR